MTADFFVDVVFRDYFSVRPEGIENAGKNCRHVDSIAKKYSKVGKRGNNGSKKNGFSFSKDMFNNESVFRRSRE